MGFGRFGERGEASRAGLQVSNLFVRILDREDIRIGGPDYAEIHQQIPPNVVEMVGCSLDDDDGGVVGISNARGGRVGGVVIS